MKHLEPGILAGIGLAIAIAGCTKSKSETGQAEPGTPRVTTLEKESPERGRVVARPVTVENRAVARTPTPEVSLTSGTAESTATKLALPLPIKSAIESIESDFDRTIQSPGENYSTKAAELRSVVSQNTDAMIKSHYLSADGQDLMMEYRDHKFDSVLHDMEKATTKHQFEDAAKEFAGVVALLNKYLPDPRWLSDGRAEIVDRTGPNAP
jgi:hypothetical protein